MKNLSSERTKFKRARKIDFRVEKGSEGENVKKKFFVVANLNSLLFFKSVFELQILKFNQILNFETSQLFYEI